MAAAVACAGREPPHHEPSPSGQLAQRVDSLPNAESFHAVASSCDQEAAAGSLSDPECVTPAYRSQRRRMRVTVKVPLANLQPLPAISAQSVQAQLHEAQGPTLHVQGLSMWSGCVVVELDLVYAEAGSAAGVAAQGGAVGMAQNLLGGNSSCPLAPELAALLQLQNIPGAADGQIISVSIANQVYLVRWDSDAQAWATVPINALPTTMLAQVPPASVQIPPRCLLLDQRLVRISVPAVGGEAAQGCTFEVVSNGVPLPCAVISDSRSADAAVAEGVVVLEIDFSQAVPGLARCNVWSAPRPVSCILATQPLLLLPAGCAAAANELALAAASAGQASADDLYADIGELLQLQCQQAAGANAATAAEGSARPESYVTAHPRSPAGTVHPPRSHAYLVELAEAAAGVLQWCRNAHCTATEHLVAAQVPLLKHLMARSLSAEAAKVPVTSPAPQAVQPSHATAAAPPAGAGATAGTSVGKTTPVTATAEAAGSSDGASCAAVATPKLAAAPAAKAGFVTSLAAAARRIDAALPVRRRQLQVSALPPMLWCCLVILKCLAASARSMIDGTGAPELVTFIMWGSPYVVMLVAQARQGSHDAANSATSGASPSTAAATASPRSAAARLAALLLPHVRVFLHLNRCLIFLLMGLGYLRVPYIFAITSAGVDFPAKALYMAMEAYDYRVAIFILLLLEPPCFYALYSRIHVPNAVMHVVALGLFGVVMQLGMQWWRRAIDVPRPKTV